MTVIQTSNKHGLKSYRGSDTSTISIQCLIVFEKKVKMVGWCLFARWCACLRGRC